MKKGLLAIGGMVLLLIISIILLVKGCEEEVSIIDNTGAVCEEEVLHFYEDEKYDYYFDCQRNYTVKIDGIDYGLETALNEKLITIEYLENEKITFNKVAK